MRNLKSFIHLLLIAVIIFLQSCGPDNTQKKTSAKSTSASTTTPTTTGNSVESSTLLTEFKKDIKNLPKLTSLPQLGMLYSIWHCTANRAPHNFVIAEAKISGQWGPLSTFHWRDHPALSSIEDYCLARNSKLATKQLELMRDLGVSFIVVDLTNNCYLEGDPAVANCASASLEMAASYQVLINAVKNLPGAPKIVPWIPFKGSLVDRVIKLMDENPEVNYKFNNKPLIIAAWDTVRDFHIGVDEKINQVKATKTVRKMWGLTGEATGPDTWSFLERCRSGFREAKGMQSCGQWGNSEMTPVATAYQETFITNSVTATPKFEGRTMTEQMKTALERKSSIVLFNGWNEWISQRFCYNNPELRIVNNLPACPIGVPEFGPNGEPTFVDMYDGEYSRDIEPDKNSDYYYQLLKSVISVVVAEAVDPSAPDIRSVYAAVGPVTGQTGSWWCKNHFGVNLGGTWECLGSNCNSNVQKNERVECGLK